LQNSPISTFIISLFLSFLSPAFNFWGFTQIPLGFKMAEYQRIWSNCLQFIKAKVGEQPYSTWFQPIVPLKLENGVLTIQVPSQFFYEWLEENYVSVLRQAIDQEIGKNGRLEYSVIVDNGNSSNKPVAISLPPQSRQVATMSANGTTIEEKEFPEEFRDALLYQTTLNPNYTFDNYIEGDCNRLARSAGYAVATKPGITSFNPLMIYGGVGLGKTHLVHSIGNEVRQHLNGKIVFYVSSEKFTNQFTDAIKNNSVQHFTNFYLQVDVLIIDDVQFLTGKEKTQEMFFHIFNHLHQNGKQIILTSDRPPKELKGLQDRLLSRFKWGLSADLQMPDFETRIAIISRKLQADGIDLPNDVIEYLAYSVDTNIRELEGVLISLMAHASLTRRDIDLELAKQILKNIVQDIDTEVGIDYIQKIVSEYFGVTVEELKDKTRKKEIVIARQVAMYFAKEYTNHSLKSIGFHFGGRDHSTVIHAVQSIDDIMQVDSRFSHSVEELRKKIKLKKS
jgi:chromosomal replication initiator protein